jgi:hypothetical protein
MNDHAVAHMVDRIRKRAMERAGTLLNQLQRERGRRSDKPELPGQTKLKAAIAEAGITPNEAKTMMAVANVPKRQEPITATAPQLPRQRLRSIL